MEMRSYIQTVVTGLLLALRICDTPTGLVENRVRLCSMHVRVLSMPSVRIAALW